MSNQATASAVSESSANPSSNPSLTESEALRPWVEADLIGIADGDNRQRGERLCGLFALVIKEAFLCGACPKAMASVLLHHVAGLEAGRLEGRSLTSIVAEEAHPRFMETKPEVRVEVRVEQIQEANQASSIKVIREELQQDLLQQDLLQLPT